MLTPYFGKDWTGAPFELFGVPHSIGLAVILGIGLYLACGWRDPSPRARRAFRYTLAAILVGNEILWHLWNWSCGWWTIQYMLPLHLCSAMVWLVAAMLVTENYTLYAFIYFLGIGAATQALLTPDSGIYGFPHFRFFQPLVSHGAIVLGAVYMTRIEKLRPTWRSLGRVIFGANIYLLAILGVNAILGSNYLFVAHKPETPTVIDLMPPWPWYILWLEAMGVAIMLLLYAPFALTDWRAGKVASPVKSRGD